MARVERHWKGQRLDEPDCIILREDGYFWALAIYYGDVPDWAPDADRSRWLPKPAP